MSQEVKETLEIVPFRQSLEGKMDPVPLDESDVFFRALRGLRLAGGIPPHEKPMTHSASAGLGSDVYVWGSS